MDFDSLTPAQVDMALKLCDILSLEDMTVGITVLSGYDWNIEKAINELQMGNVQEPYMQTPPLQKPSYSAGSQQAYDYNDVDYDEEEPEEDDGAYEYDYLANQKKKMFQQEYVSLLPLQKTHSEPNKELFILQNHRKLAEEDRMHRKHYMNDLLKKSGQLCEKLLQSNQEGMHKYNQNKRKIESNRTFINFLYNSYHPRINFTFGTFFLNLTRSYLEDKYLLVYIHSVAPQIEAKFSKIVQLILRQKEIAKFINENCITYGMFDNSDDYELIQKHVPLKNLPAFALFKLSKSKRAEEFISEYKISSQGDIFLQWAAKSMGISLKKKQGSHIQQEKAVKEDLKKVQMKQKKQKQKNVEKIKKQQEYIAHKDIRYHQDELWAELEKMNFQKKQLSLDRRENIKNNQEQLSQRRSQADKEKQPEEGPTVIQVRFRMPISGQSKSRRFLPEDKIIKMFTYVDCYCRDQFQEKFADFDLKQSFPPLNLFDKKDQTIGQVFEGSNRENVIVREI